MESGCPQGLHRSFSSVCYWRSELVDRLLPWDVKVYGTDKWATYASVIPQDTLVQSKAMTHEIERNHGRQRHWFGRFKRKSILSLNPKRW
jgi:IS1 family transposase